jgi:ubiquitin C-terminal hydrolase
MFGGHYNCFSWNEDISQWVFFDDSQCAPMSGPSTSDNDIYQLVYSLTSE